MVRVGEDEKIRMVLSQKIEGQNFPYLNKKNFKRANKWTNYKILKMLHCVDWEACREMNKNGVVTGWRAAAVVRVAKRYIIIA
jgi:hypothetical protein